MVSAVLSVRCSFAERPIAFHDRCAFANERVKIGPRIKSAFRRWKINCLELTAVPTVRPEIFQIHPGYAANFGDSPWNALVLVPSVKSMALDLCRIQVYAVRIFEGWSDIGRNTRWGDITRDRRIPR